MPEKTPDEIKKGLECASVDCQNAHDCEKTCAYYKECSSFDYQTTEIPCTMIFDTLAYIQHLEDANAELLTRVKQLEAKCHQLERERDAAVNELIGTCQVCRWEETEKCASCHFNSDAWNVCEESNWEWCGVKEE